MRVDPYESVQVLSDFLDLCDTQGGTVRLELVPRFKQTGEEVVTAAMRPVLALELLLPELDTILEKARRLDALTVLAAEIGSAFRGTA